MNKNNAKNQSLPEKKNIRKARQNSLLLKLYEKRLITEEEMIAGLHYEQDCHAYSEYLRKHYCEEVGSN
jgi:hypothetical protein